MPVTVRGGDILFNDGTTQSTAGGAVNTTTVLNANAGASAGAVGTYAFLGKSSYGTIAVGSTVAGSNLRYAGISTPNNWLDFYATSPYSSGINTAPAGTWRAMGFGFSQSPYLGATLWLRIS